MSGTFYMTSHEITPTIPIHRGTLQGGTLLPFLFMIFVEPLLVWLRINIIGCRPTHQTEQPYGTYISYDDHGYADDICIATSILANLHILI